MSGEREGVYVRLAPPDGARLSLVVPLNREAADYSLLLDAALETLRSRYTAFWSRRVSALTLGPTADAFRFVKETNAPTGTISWQDGQQLIEAARLTMVAGAKAFVEPARYFSNKHGQFAKRYLDTVLMGQTSPGSYIITAIAPADAHIPLRGGVATPIGLPDDYASSADITNRVVESIRATSDALVEYRSSRSFDSFIRRIGDGVSHEMATALQKLAADADGVRINVQRPNAPSEDSEAEEFEFAGDDVAILGRAAALLVQPEQRDRVVVVGRVHLLTRKEAGGPGVVGIDDGKRKFRARLNADDEYHKAVVAHDENNLVQVSGEVERTGNLNWLYDARLIRVLSPLESIDARVESIPTELFDSE